MNLFHLNYLIVENKRLTAIFLDPKALANLSIYLLVMVTNIFLYLSPGEFISSKFISNDFFKFFSFLLRGFFIKASYGVPVFKSLNERGRLRLKK